MSLENVLRTPHDRNWWENCKINPEKNEIIEKISDSKLITSIESNEIKNISLVFQKAIDQLTPSTFTEWETIQKNVNHLNQKLNKLNHSVKISFVNVANLQAKQTVKLFELEKKWKQQGINFQLKDQIFYIKFDKEITTHSILEMIKELPPDIQKVSLEGLEQLEINHEIFFSFINNSSIRSLDVNIKTPITLTYALNLASSFAILNYRILNEQTIKKFIDELLILADKNPEQESVLKTYASILYNKIANKSQAQENLLGVLGVRLEAAKKIKIGQEEPIGQILEMAKEANNNQIKILPISEPKINSLDLGMSIQKQDTSDLKTETLHVIERRTEKGSVLECDFKVSRDFRRDQIGSFIELMQDLEEGNTEVKDFLIENEICEDLILEKKGAQYWRKNDQTYEPITLISDQVARFEFVGLGTVTIGNDYKNPSLYNRVVVQIDSNNISKEEATEKLNLLMHMMGMGSFLHAADKNSQIRYQMAILLNEFFPETALEIVQSRNFTSTSIDELKKTIIKKHPEMEQIIEMNLSKTVYIDILPGYKEMIIPGLAQQCYDAGARGLVQGIGNQFSSPTSNLNTMISILKFGSLSTQAKYNTGLTYGGDSPEADHKSNAADVVFSRLTTSKHISPDKSLPVRNLRLAGRGQFIYHLNVLNRPSYQYPTDMHGTRVGSDYKKRLSKTGLIKELSKQNDDKKEVSLANEFMFKHCIPSHNIKGMILHDYRPKLIEFLKEENILTVENNELQFDGNPVTEEELFTIYSETLRDMLLDQQILVEDVPDVFTFDTDTLMGISFEECLTDWRKAATSLLREHDLIKLNEEGKECVNGVLIDEFIHVSDEITYKMILPACKEYTEKEKMEKSL